MGFLLVSLEVFSGQDLGTGKEARLAGDGRQVCFIAPLGDLFEGHPIIWTRWIMNSSMFFYM